MPNDNNNERKIPNNPNTTSPNQKPPMPGQQADRSPQRNDQQRNPMPGQQGQNDPVKK
jgi:hypothetical protein